MAPRRRSHQAIHSIAALATTLAMALLLSFTAGALLAPDAYAGPLDAEGEGEDEGCGCCGGEGDAEEVADEGCGEECGDDCAECGVETATDEEEDAETPEPVIEPVGFDTPEEAVLGLAERALTEDAAVVDLLAIIPAAEHTQGRRFYAANWHKFEAVELEVAEVTLNEDETAAEVLVKLEGAGELAAMGELVVNAVQTDVGWQVSLVELFDNYNAIQVAFALANVAFAVMDLADVENGASMDEWAEAAGVDIDEVLGEYPQFEAVDVTITIADRDELLFSLTLDDADLEDNASTPIGRWVLDSDYNLEGPGAEALSPE